MTIVETILLALSLSVDSLSVSMAGSVSLGKATPSKVIPVMLVFGLLQAGLLFVGWALGDLIAAYVEKVASIIGFLLLLYIGGEMIVEALKKGDDNHEINLSGMKSLMLAGVATSIDASAVGVSMAMGATAFKEIIVTVLLVFVITALTVLCGILFGSAIGKRFGKGACIVGGIVLICIGVSFLIS